LVFIHATSNVVAEENLWFSFMPPQDGYYAFPTTGGYDKGATSKGYDYFIIYPICYDANGKAIYKWKTPYYEAGETYYVLMRVIATDLAPRQADYTIMPRLYTYTEPLKSKVFSEYQARLLSDVLKGSAYSVKDVEVLNTRGNIVYSSDGKNDIWLEQTNGADLYSAGYLDIYFRDGTYTMVTVDTHDLSNLFSSISAFFARISNFFASIRIFFSSLVSKFQALFTR